MKNFARNKVWVTGLLLAAMATSTLAPVAEAGRGKWKNRDRRESRYRDGGEDQRSRDWNRDDREVQVQRRVRYADRSYSHYPSRGHSGYGTYVVRRSNAGPVIAGFIGGLFLGAALSNTPPRGYDYYDPYCHQRFSTLDAYYRESYAHHHPHQIRVVACDSEWGCRGGHSGYRGGYDGYGDEYADYQDDGCND